MQIGTGGDWASAGIWSAAVLNSSTRARHSEKGQRWLAF